MKGALKVANKKKGLRSARDSSHMTGAHGCRCSYACLVFVIVAALRMTHAAAEANNAMTRPTPQSPPPNGTAAATAANGTANYTLPSVQRPFVFFHQVRVCVCVCMCVCACVLWLTAAAQRPSCSSTRFGCQLRTHTLELHIRVIYEYI